MMFSPADFSFFKAPAKFSFRIVHYTPLNAFIITSPPYKIIPFLRMPTITLSCRFMLLLKSAVVISSGLTLLGLKFDSFIQKSSTTFNLPLSIMNNTSTSSAFFASRIEPKRIIALLSFSASFRSLAYTDAREFFARVLFRLNRQDASALSKEIFDYSGYEVKTMNRTSPRFWIFAEEWEYKTEGGIIPIHTAEMESLRDFLNMTESEF